MLGKIILIGEDVLTTQPLVLRLDVNSMNSLMQCNAAYKVQSSYEP
jgi:hypothetical protein